MNKIYFSKAIITLCVLLLLSIATKTMAQYEQKLTLQGSGVFMIPNIVTLQDEETFIEDFASGIGIDGGVQYNVNRFFSWMANARFYYNNQADGDGEYNNIAFGGGFKINMAGRKKINPYLLAEANLNSVWFGYTYSHSEGITSDYQEDYYLTIGGMAGLGFDIRFNDHIGMFIQSSAYYTHYDSYIGLYNQVGIRISLVKARTI
jgi:hypothetical protein